jgi:hypothetical protein
MRWGAATLRRLARRRPEKPHGRRCRVGAEVDSDGVKALSGPRCGSAAGPAMSNVGEACHLSPFQGLMAQVCASYLETDHDQRLEVCGGRCRPRAPRRPRCGGSRRRSRWRGGWRRRRSRNVGDQWPLQPCVWNQSRDSWRVGCSSVATGRPQRAVGVQRPSYSWRASGPKHIHIQQQWDRRECTAWSNHAQFQQRGKCRNRIFR